jgi:hypothetical protein
LSIRGSLLLSADCVELFAGDPQRVFLRESAVIDGVLPAELVKEAAKIDPHDEALYCLVNNVRDLGPTALRFSLGSLKSLLADLDRGHETRLRLPAQG